MNKKSMITIALSAISAFSFVSCSAEPVELAIPTYADDKKITIGIWNGSRHDLNDTDLYNLQNAGIDLLVGPNPSKYTEMDLIDRCAKFGINVLLDQRNKWDGTAPEYMDRENFWGYLIWDEPYIGMEQSLAQLKEEYDKVMGDKMFFVNMLPSGADQVGFEDYLTTFAKNLDLPVVSYDNYSLMLDDITQEVYIRESYLYDFDVASKYAQDMDVPFWYTFLTCGHLNYADPTVTDLEWQMYLAMTYGAEGLVHYVYATHDPDYVYPIVNYETGDVTEKYYRVQEADATIRSWDHIFMSFDWLGTSNVEGTNGKTGLLDWTVYQKDINAYGEMVSATSTEDVIVGHFKDGNDNAGFMVTNVTNPYDHKVADVSLQLAAEYQGALIIHEGVETVVSLKENNMLDIEIPTGSAKFVIPLKAK